MQRRYLLNEMTVILTLQQSESFSGESQAGSTLAVGLRDDFVGPPGEHSSQAQVLYEVPDVLNFPQRNARESPLQQVSNVVQRLLLLPQHDVRIHAVDQVGVIVLPHDNALVDVDDGHFALQLE